MPQEVAPGHCIPGQCVLFRLAEASISIVRDILSRGALTWIGGPRRKIAVEYYFRVFRLFVEFSLDCLLVKVPISESLWPIALQGFYDLLSQILHLILGRKAQWSQKLFLGRLTETRGVDNGPNHNVRILNET